MTAQGLIEVPPIAAGTVSKKKRKIDVKKNAFAKRQEVENIRSVFFALISCEPKALHFPLMHVLFNTLQVDEKHDLT